MLKVHSSKYHNENTYMNTLVNYIKYFSQLHLINIFMLSGEIINQQ